MSDELEAVGAFATAGLAARALEGGGPAGEHEAVCANCGTPLGGPYCHVCGQRSHVHRSLLHMGEELVHGIAHFDGKIWRTLPLLAFKPGKLTRLYIEGRRASFVSPMALFLFVVFLMFLVFSFTGHGDKSIADGINQGIAEGQIGSWKAPAAVNQAFEARADRARQELAATVAEGKDPTLAAETVTEWERAAAGSAVARQGSNDNDIGAGKTADFKVDTGIPGLDETVRHMAKNPELLLYKLKNTAYKFSFLLVPISLPFIWLMFFWRRDVVMYDHAVFALYSLSFMSLLFTMAALLSGLEAVPTVLLVLLVTFAPPIHMYKQLKYTYGLSRAGAAVRTFLLLLFSAIALGLFAAAIFALGVSE